MPRILRKPEPLPHAAQGRDVSVVETKFGAQSAIERRVNHVTPEQRRARLMAVEQMLTLGSTPAQMEAALKAQFNMGPGAVASYVARVRARWAAEGEQDRAQLKKAAVKRLQQHIRGAVAKGQFSAVAQLERLLADIQGTKEAVEVNLNVSTTVTEAVIGIVTGMTAEEQAALIEEQRRLLQRAEGAPAVVIEAEGVASST